MTSPPRRRQRQPAAGTSGEDNKRAGGAGGTVDYVAGGAGADPSMAWATALAATRGKEARAALWRQLIQDVKDAASNNSTGRMFVAEAREVLKVQVPEDADVGAQSPHMQHLINVAVPGVAAAMRRRQREGTADENRGVGHPLVDPDTGAIKPLDFKKDKDLKTTGVGKELYDTCTCLIKRPAEARQDLRLQRALNVVPYVPFYPRGVGGVAWTREEVEENLRQRQARTETHALVLVDVIMYMAYFGNCAFVHLLIYITLAVASGGGLTHHGHDILTAVGLLPGRGVVANITNVAAATYKRNFQFLYQSLLSASVSTFVCVVLVLLVDNFVVRVAKFSKVKQLIVCRGRFLGGVF